MFPQDHSGQFSWNNARALAVASQLAYLEPDEARVKSAVLGATGFWYVHSGDIHAYVVTDGKSMVVAFRGTASIRNWLTDAEECPYRIGMTAIVSHLGFYAGLESVWDQLLPIVAAFKGVIYVTGHSLGGALARQAGFRLHWFHSIKTIRYTFGEPRNANAAMRRHDRENGLYHYRIVDREDIVPRVPFAFGFWEHGGVDVFRDSFGRWNFDMPWWQKIPSDITGIVGGLHIAKELTLIDDHFMHEYTEVLADAPGLLLPRNNPIGLAA